MGAVGLIETARPAISARSQIDPNLDSNQTREQPHQKPGASALDTCGYA